MRKSCFRVKESSGTQRKEFLLFLGVVFLSIFFPILALSQGKGGRDANPPKTPSKRGTVRAPNRPAPKPKLASIVLNVSPPDSSLLIDDQPSDKVDALGTAKFTELKPGQHSVTVRKAGYREKQQSLDLKAGDNEPVSITLEMLKGTLSVLPGISEAEINLTSVDRNQGVGSYAGSITQIEFPPGDYEITVSKKGYKTVTRRFTLKAGESVYLEPQLEALPKPRPQIAMSALVRPDGKYLSVQLLGTSGADLPRSGSINVSATKGAGFADVSGTFTGLPCEVDLVRGDNVSEASLIEVPGPTNQWAKAIVRVRAKDSKHPARFAINWRLQGGGGLPEESLQSPTGTWVGRSQTIDQGETRNFPMSVNFDQKSANDGECPNQGRIISISHDVISIEWPQCGRETVRYSIVNGMLSAAGETVDILGNRNRPLGIKRSWTLTHQ
jgi:hypothetical protein